MGGDAGAGFCHAVALLEAALGEFLLEELDYLFAQRCCAAGEASEVREVVFVDNRVADHPDQDWWDEEEFFQLVFDDGVEHGLHCEGGEHDDGGVDEDWEVQDVDEAGDVEGGQDGEDFAEVLGCDLHHLQALGYDVLVGDHDLCMKRTLSAAVLL